MWVFDQGIGPSSHHAGRSETRAGHSATLGEDMGSATWIVLKINGGQKKFVLPQWWFSAS
jgi:hypothetical protein